MTEVIAVRLHDRSQSRLFMTDGLDLRDGDPVVVETQQGLEYGVCCGKPTEMDLEPDEEEADRILRFADERDEDDYRANLKEEQRALRICREKVAEHNLPMNLVEAELLLDRRRLIFYFTADGRIDFRELVKDLAATFHTRIELRQIGVRDETRMKGGLGVCGRELCCCAFLKDFQPVSIKMAKEQNLSMNPTKISGACGRLLCCLKYEQEAYEDAHHRLPRAGERVQTAEGPGRIIDVNLLKETVTVRLDRDDGADAAVLPAAEVTVFREEDGSRPAKRNRSSGRRCPRTEGGRCPREDREQPEENS